MSICRGICVLLSAHWQYSYHHPQWMEKRRRKNHPQAFPRPAPSCETMHLNTASGLSLFRPDFLFGALLLHFHSIHFLYSNPVKGKSDKVTCLSCFRGLLERTSYSKPYFLVYHPSTWKRRFVDFFFPEVGVWLHCCHGVNFPVGDPEDVGWQQGKSTVIISLSLGEGKTMGCEFRERRRPAMLQGS